MSNFLPWDFAGSALALAGDTMQAIGNYKAKMGEASLLRDKAAQEGIKRKELGFRALSNMRNLRLSAEAEIGSQVANIAGNGVQVGGETSLELKHNMNQIASRNMEDKVREHSYEAKTSVTEQKYMLKSAGQHEKAAKISLAAGLLQAAGNAALGVGSSIT